VRQRWTQFSPPQIPAEYIAQNRVAKQRFLIPFIVSHEFLLVFFNVELSMPNAAVPSQRPSLWAMPSALIQNQAPVRFPDGIA
jgi:hypothetical protein